jgi:hypothetical protein
VGSLNNPIWLNKKYEDRVEQEIRVDKKPQFIKGSENSKIVQNPIRKEPLLFLSYAFLFLEKGLLAVSFKK